MLSGSGSTDFDEDDEAEILTAKDILDAEALAERYEADDDRTLADRAAADRRWTYGHVIVDEAQELIADGVAGDRTALPAALDDRGR